MNRRDARLRPPVWDAAAPDNRRHRAIRLLLTAVVPLALFYFAWLLAPDRVGHPVLYGLLVAAELFNFAQALGFWWTCAGERRPAPSSGPSPTYRAGCPRRRSTRSCARSQPSAWPSMRDSKNKVSRLRTRSILRKPARSKLDRAEGP